MSEWAEEANSSDLVLAFEASPYSDAALDFAVEMAERLGARLHVVHVTDLADYPVNPDLAGSNVEADTVRNSLEHRKAEVERLMTVFTGEWTYTGETGNAVERLNRIANQYNALAIVLGASAPGLGGALHRALKGSVLRDMTKHSNRVVMVVPEHSPLYEQ